MNDEHGHTAQEVMDLAVELLRGVLKEHKAWADKHFDAGTCTHLMWAAMGVAYGAMTAKAMKDFDLPTLERLEGLMLQLETALKHPSEIGADQATQPISFDVKN